VRSKLQFTASHRAKIHKIINDSAGDCSLKFDHVMLDVPRTFKVNGSKVKVTA